MLLVDERCLQADLLGADRIVPVASVAASRDLDASSSTQRAAAYIAAATNLHQHRPSGICRVVSAGTWRAGRFEDRQAGDRDPLASCRLPSVLALEIKTAQWPSKDPAGNPSAHSRDQSRQPIVGRTCMYVFESRQAQGPPNMRSGEIDAAFAILARERPDALLVAADAFFLDRRMQFATLAAR